MSRNRRRNRIAAAWAATLLGSVPLAASACNSESYIGTVCTFAMNYCPQGFLPADGRLVTLNDNQALYALLGITYGGDGRTNFGLPDLRGRAIAGVGQGAGLTPVTLGQKTGQQQVSLTAAQTPLVQHSHAATFAPVTGNNIVNIPGAASTLAVTATLPVSPGVGTGSGVTVASLGAGQTGYLAGISGTTGVDAVTFTGLYTATAPGANAASLPAQVNVTGTPARPAVDVQVASVTGGAVTVQPAAAAATAAVTTQSPIIGMTVCIASMGLYPSRP